MRIRSAVRAPALRGLLSTVLTCALVVGTASSAVADAVAEDETPTSVTVWDGDNLPNGQSSLGQVALLPLDDRPYTLYAPQKLGGAFGFEVNTPQPEVLGRHFTPGDGARAGDWLVRAARAAGDTVIALPMLAYGGLLNSRNSSVSQETALRNLESVRTVRKQNPGERLYAFDTIMRLTPEGPWRTKIRQWATLVDEVRNLGMDEKTPQLDLLESEIPQDVREDYLATRKRNHELNLAMLEWAAEGVFDYLVIGQDDASGTGLHRPEALALAARIRELGVQDRVVLYPGADVVASLLLAKIAVEDAGTEPSVYVEYSRTHGAEWTAPYQNIRYERLITGYVATIGGRMTTDIDDADVVLMANTGGSQASVQPFAERVVEYIESGRTVALGDDAIAGLTDTRLMALLDGRITRGRLDSYSGWNIGIPLSQSMGRHALLERARTGALPPGAAMADSRPVADWRRALLNEAAEQSLELTLSEWVQTNSYRNFVRNATTAYASELGEPDPQNLKTFYEQVDAFAREHTLPHARKLFDEHFTGVHRPMGVVGEEKLELVPTRVAEWNVRLPWLRTGEIAAEPDVVSTVHSRALSTEEQHGDVAGVQGPASAAMLDRLADWILATADGQHRNGLMRKLPYLSSPELYADGRCTPVDPCLQPDVPQSTAACSSLEFLAHYYPARAQASGRTVLSSELAILDEFADAVLAYQVDQTPAHADLFDGAVASALGESQLYYTTFGNAMCGQALLSAHEVTGTQAYLDAATDIGDFLLRMQDPRPYYAPYGVQPFVDADGNATEPTGGFFDQVSSWNNLFSTMSLWNLTASAFLVDLEESAGSPDGRYRTAAALARTFLEEGLDLGTDWYTVRFSSPATAKNRVVAQSANSANCRDARWHRKGSCAYSNGLPSGGTLGTDMVEYGLAGLYGYESRVNDETTASAAVAGHYQRYSSLSAIHTASANDPLDCVDDTLAGTVDPYYPPDNQGTVPTEDPWDYDAHMSFGGYVRSSGTNLSTAEAKYYDIVGFGILAEIRSQLVPAKFSHAYARFIAAGDRALVAIQDRSLAPMALPGKDEADLDRDGNTGESVCVVTEGTLPIAHNGIGILATVGYTT